jgi:UPF0176 protein
MLQVITTYKFKKLDKKKLEKLKQEIKDFCKVRGIFGRILIGEEGVNAGFAGEKNFTQEFKKLLEKKFGKMTYRELQAKLNPYPKLQVKVRKEIVVFGVKVNPKKTGKYLQPKQLKKLLDKKSDLVIIDTRNDYETEVGRFKGAIIPPIQTFKEFPAWIKKQKHLKNKKIVTYCTGGIRCEKATAYMKDIGFKDVSQIKGGVINYCQEYPDTYWEGSLFVFDNRLTASMESSKAIAKCKLCGKDTQNSTNCSNVECNAIYNCCKDCLEKFDNCCSIECLKADRKRELPNVFNY